MHQTRLIVNADDFGYFDSVSRGILHAIEAGQVTATGIMANGDGLANRVVSLQAADGCVDLGVHLNLSLGEPVTRVMRRRLARWGGRFPTKFTVAGAILCRMISIEDVRAEWAAQIERCLRLGIEPWFLNSHEHLHMLPPLFAVALELAEEYEIPHVRHVSPEPLASVPPHGTFRNLVMSVLQLVHGRREQMSPHFVGLGASGRLTTQYLRRRFSFLRPGRTYELMCHPGYYDSEEIEERYLTRYHEWESELRLLTGGTFQAICTEFGIGLIGYRDLCGVPPRTVSEETRRDGTESRADGR